MKISERTIIWLSIMLIVLICVVVLIKSKNSSAWLSILESKSLDYDVEKHNHFYYTVKEEND